MRKITQEAVSAFNANCIWHKANTDIMLLRRLFDEQEQIVMRLHGNQIARKDRYSYRIEISTAGWKSNTTKERLNGLPGVSIYQKNFQWYLNGHAWDGTWVNPAEHVIRAEAAIELARATTIDLAQLLNR